MKYFEVNIILDGKKNTKFVKARTKMEAINNIQSATGGTLLKIKEVSAPFSVKLEEYKELIQNKLGKKKVKIQDFSIFLRQLAVMTNAGISLIDALHEGIASTNDKQVKNIAIKVTSDIESGLSMTEALSDYEYEVGSITIAMVKMGEMTGQLSEAFLKLASILENIKHNRDNMKKALRMPVISMIALVGAFVFLVMIVIPKFKGIFSKFGADLPLPTKILLGIESALSNYGLFILLGLAGLFAAHKHAYQNNEMYKYGFDKAILRVYLTGMIIRISSLERFIMIVAELLRTGIPLTTALETAASTVDNLYLKEKFVSIETAIQKGSSLAEALRDTALFEHMVIQMTKSGESSGQIDIMLKRVADYYNTKFQSIINNISTFIEPILMVVVAAMVLLLALGIFLPMWDLSSAVQGKGK